MHPHWEALILELYLLQPLLDGDLAIPRGLRLNTSSTVSCSLGHI